MDDDTLFRCQRIREHIVSLNKSLEWAEREKARLRDGDSDSKLLSISMSISYETWTAPSTSTSQQHLDRESWLRIVDIMICSYRDQIDVLQKEYAAI